MAVHVVVAGDTLSKIAATYGTTVAVLLSLNPQIVDKNLIRVGDDIVLPATEPAGAGVFNVKDYGAVGDGTTDDTAAIQAAIDAAAVQGGDVLIPLTADKYTYTFLDLAGLGNVRLIGTGSATDPLSPSLLVFNGTGSGSTIAVGDADAITFQNLSIVYDSSSFSGILVDLDAVDSTQRVTFRDCSLWSGNQRTTQTATLVGANNTDTVLFENVNFGGGDVLVRGKTAAGSHSNAVKFTHCTFGNAATAQILDPGSSWTFDTCVVQGVEFAPRFIRTSLPSGSSKGLVLVNNWYGDANLADSWVEWNGYGLAVVGGMVSVGHADSVFVKLTDKSFGVSITGLYTTGQGWLVDDTAVGTSEQVVVVGNHISAGVDVFKGGIIPDGALYHDAAGVVHVQGDDQFTVDGQMRIQGRLLVVGLAKADDLISVYPTDSSTVSFYQTAEGVMWWGDGEATPDVQLRRYAPNYLGTPDSFRVDGNLDHRGTRTGFYGTNPILKQTGVAVSAEGVHAALVALGLIDA